MTSFLNKNKTNILVFFLLLLLAVLLHYSVGFYLEDYEIFFNYAVQIVAHNSSQAIIASSDNFLLYPVYVEIQKLFPSIAVYGVLKLVLIFLSIYSITISLLRNKSLTKSANIFLLAILFLLFFENIVVIQNTRIGVLLTLAAFLQLYSDHANKKKALFLFYFITILAITNRIQLSIILSFCGLIIALFSRNKFILKHSLVYFSLSVAAYAMFLFLSFGNLDNLKNYAKYERALYNQKNFILADNANLDLSISPYEVKIFAKSLFIKDEPTLESINFSELLKHKSLFDYVFRNDQIFDIVSSKLKNTLQLTTNYILPLSLLLLLLWMALVYYLKNSLKSLIMLFVFLSIIAFITTFAELNLPILHSLLALCCFSILIFINSQSQKKYVTSINSISLLLILFQFFLFSKNYVEEKKEVYKTYIAFKELYAEDIQLEQKSIFAYLYYEDILPSKLFTNNQILYDQVVYLDYATLNNFKSFDEINAAVFRASNDAILKKYHWVIEHNNGVIYVDDFLKKFMTLYIYKIHGERLHWKFLGKSEKSGIKKYKVSF